MGLRLLVFLCFSFIYSITQAQTEKTAASDKLEVFIDCRAFCDLTYLKSKITYINYVRDQQLADVHLLITTYPLSGGSVQYTLEFIGREDLEGIENIFTFDNPANTPTDKLRKKILKHIELGLVAYLLHTETEMKLSIKNKTKEAVLEVEDDDPWDFWIFSVYASGSLNKESQRRTFNFSSGFEAERVTEEWRITQDFYFRGNYRKINKTEEDIVSNLRRLGLYGRAVKSIDEHWSVGFFDNFSSTTFSNVRFGMRVGPALEYSIFPYKDVANKEFTLAYHFGYNFQDYYEETIYGKLAERLWDQSIRASLRLRQPWGSVYSALVGKHFYHDFSKNNLRWNNRMTFRLIKGLAFDFTANFELINDQLAIEKGEATLEEVLLQQKQLATDYELYLAMGFRYTFGSIYNNIVNTRL